MAHALTNLAKDTKGESMCMKSVSTRLVNLQIAIMYYKARLWKN